MIRAALCLGLLVVPVGALAQTSDFRLAGLIMPTRQNLFTGQETYSTSAVLTGVEGQLWSGGIGLYGRYLSGTLGDRSARGPDGQLRMAEGRLLLGAPLFSIEAGYARRVRGGGLGDAGDNLFRVGLRSVVALGPGGFSLTFHAGAYGRSDSVRGNAPASSLRKELGVVGWEAGTGLIYQAPSGLPLYLMAGYRFERVRSELGFPPIQREELSGLVLGGGLRYLGRRSPR
jgi:hypothetical protein